MTISAVNWTCPLAHVACAGTDVFVNANRLSIISDNTSDNLPCYNIGMNPRTFERVILVLIIILMALVITADALSNDCMR